MIRLYKKYISNGYHVFKICAFGIFHFRDTGMLSSDKKKAGQTSMTGHQSITRPRRETGQTHAQTHPCTAGLESPTTLSVQFLNCERKSALTTQPPCCLSQRTLVCKAEITYSLTIAEEKKPTSPTSQHCTTRAIINSHWKRFTTHVPHKCQSHLGILTLNQRDTHPW